MNDALDNLVPEHLKRFQASQDRILGHLASADAQQQLASDGFDQRLERIKRRLELA